MIIPLPYHHAEPDLSAQRSVHADAPHSLLSLRWCNRSRARRHTAPDIAYIFVTLLRGFVRARLCFRCNENGGPLETNESGAVASRAGERAMSAHVAASRLDSALEQNDTRAFMSMLKEVIRNRG